MYTTPASSQAGLATLPAGGAYAAATARQLALGVDAPINGGGDVLICAHGIGQCHARGEVGHIALSPMYTPAYAAGDAWDHNGRTI